MFRYIPLSLILVATLAGCGGSSSSPAPGKVAPATHKTAIGVPPANVIYVGTGRTGNTVHGTTAAFPKFTNMVWDAHLSSAETKPLILVINRTDAVKNPIVWYTTVPAPKGLYVPGQLTVTQLKRHGIKLNVHYGLSYVVGANPTTLRGGTVLASGYFGFGPQAEAPPNPY